MEAKITLTKDPLHLIPYPNTSTHLPYMCVCTLIPRFLFQALFLLNLYTHLHTFPAVYIP